MTLHVYFQESKTHTMSHKVSSILVYLARSTWHGGHIVLSSHYESLKHFLFPRNTVPHTILNIEGIIEYETVAYEMCISDQ